MRTHVVHLYESIGNMKNDFSHFSEDLFAFDSFPVVGIVSNDSLNMPSRQTIVKELKLKPFEIIQDHFDLFIKKADKLGVKLQKIEFTHEIEFELEEEIDDALYNNDYEEIFKIIKQIRNEHVDIFSISFFYEGNRYRMTKHAVAEVLGESSNEIPNIIIQSPLSLIAGLKKFPSSEAF